MSLAAWLIRQAFDRDGVRTDAALRELVPDDVSGEVDLPYGPGPDERYDVWRPAGVDLPIVFWVHGGGWIAGDKTHVTSYAKILAGRGFEVVTPNYTLSPRARYPHALRQVGAALVAALAGSERPFVLAGDSAGAHLAAQLGVALTDPSYAAALGLSLPAVGRPSGMLLHCTAVPTCRRWCATPPAPAAGSSRPWRRPTWAHATSTTPSSARSTWCDT